MKGLGHMRQKDLDRVVAHINYHIDHPQRDPIRGKVGWAYVKVTRWLIEQCLEAGILGEPRQEKHIPGEDVRKSKDRC